MGHRRRRHARAETADLATFEAGFLAGTTSIQAADAEGWGGVDHPERRPGCRPTIAGRTGIGLSQRMQSFVLDEAVNPYNVLEPGKRPRATLTPGMALKDGKPYSLLRRSGGATLRIRICCSSSSMWWNSAMNVQEAAEAGEHHELPDAELLRRPLSHVPGA